MQPVRERVTQTGVRLIKWCKVDSKSRYWICLLLNCIFGPICSVLRRLLRCGRRCVEAPGATWSQWPLGAVVKALTSLNDRSVRTTREIWKLQPSILPVALFPWQPFSLFRYLWLPHNYWIITFISLDKTQQTDLPGWRLDYMLEKKDMFWYKSEKL